jgi:hypothetical protein
VTFQNLDSSEISLTDVSHYFDSDPTKLVAGLRGDGRTPSAFIADTTTANAQVGNCSAAWHARASLLPTTDPLCMCPCRCAAWAARCGWTRAPSC